MTSQNLVEVWTRTESAFETISPHQLMSDRSGRDRVHGVPIWRHDNGRWYADFRSFDGRRRSLKTEDREKAEARVYERKQELEEALSNQRGTNGDPQLERLIERYLDYREDRVADSTWSNDERALGYLAQYVRNEIGEGANVSAITPNLIEGWQEWRLKSVKASTVGVEQSALSRFLKFAKRRQFTNQNAATLVQRPRVEPTEATYLEIGEAARVLRTSGAMENDPNSRCYDHLHAVIATFLLTGARRSEVFGLKREDIDLEHGEIAIRPNQWRNLKTEQSRRYVPLWPQLREVLVPYLEERDDDSELLFPNRDGAPLGTLRWALTTLEDRTPDMDKHLTLKVFRHTYTATRIQTVERGHPVSLFSVARELGHKGVSRIEDTYGHLQNRRTRLEEVRYEDTDVIEMAQQEKSA